MADILTSRNSYPLAQWHARWMLSACHGSQLAFESALNRRYAFSRVIGSNPFKGRAVLPFFEYVRFSRKSKEYKPFKGPSWYNPTDAAVKPTPLQLDCLLVRSWDLLGTSP